MERLKYYFLIAMFIFAFNSYLYSSDNERPEAIMLLASATLKDMANAVEWEKVSPYMQECVAIGVFPGLKKGGYIIGGQFGRGVIVHKTGNGKWTAPAFYKIKGGSIGFQLGIQEIDLILIFQTEKSFRDFLQKGYDIGVAVSAAAGPIGRNFQKKQGDIFAYSKAKGLFAGISISGAKLSFDFDWSKSFYKEAYNEKMILVTNEVEHLPKSGITFLQTVTKVME